MPPTEPAPRRIPKQEQEHAQDEIVEVAPGVLRLQLPIQMTGLGHVNMYTMLDERGAAVVDPGMPGPASWRWVPKRLKAAGLKLTDIHTVIVTHSHPDHFGGAGQLAKEAGAEVVTHADFRTWGMPPHRHEAPDAPDAAASEVDAEAEAAAPQGPPWGAPPPWGGATSPERERRRMMRDIPFRRRLMYRMMGSSMAHGAMRRIMHPLTVTQRLSDGDVIKLAGREWTAVHTPGHTPDHLCLYDPEEGIVISGDHVLPTITPHIGGMGAEPNPLDNFFSSLERMKHLGPVSHVLPAHGHPFPDMAARVDAIRAHHEERLDKLAEVSAALGPSSVVEYSHHLFRQERWGNMAESETYAHLEYLFLRGEAERRSEHGSLIYELAPRAGSSRS